MKITRSILISRTVGYVLMLGLTFFCYLFQQNSFTVISTAFVVMNGILLMAFIPITFTRSNEIEHNTPPLSQRWFSLILSQMVIILSSGILLLGLVIQSQVTKKLQALSAEGLFLVIHEKAFICGFLPWVFISLLAVLSTFQGQQQQRMIWLPGLTMGEGKKHPFKFFLSSYNDVLNIAITAIAVILMSISIGFVCEGLSHYYGVASLWKAPYRNMIFLLIVLIFSYSWRHKLLKKYVHRHFSLGSILLIEAFILIVALLLFEAMLNFSEFPINETQLVAYKPAAVDPTASLEMLGTILLLWPLCLIPYLVPFLAKFGAGLKAWQAFLIPLIVPAVFFLGLSPTIGQVDFLHVIDNLKTSITLCALGFSGLLATLFLYQHVHSFFELHANGITLPQNLPYKNVGLFQIAHPFVKGVISWSAIACVSGWFIVHIMFFGIGLFLLLCLACTCGRFLVQPYLGKFKRFVNERPI